MANFRLSGVGVAVVLALVAGSEAVGGEPCRVYDENYKIIGQIYSSESETVPDRLVLLPIPGSNKEIPATVTPENVEDVVSNFQKPPKTSSTRAGFYKYQIYQTGGTFEMATLMVGPDPYCKELVDGKTSENKSILTFLSIAKSAGRVRESLLYRNAQAKPGQGDGDPQSNGAALDRSYFSNQNQKGIVESTSTYGGSSGNSGAAIRTNEAIDRTKGSI